MSHIRCVISTAFALLLAACSAKRPLKLETAYQVEFDLLVVQIPEGLAGPFIPELRDKRKASAATAKVVKLIEENKAKLVAWPVLSTKNGQRAVVEQCDEFRYAVEYAVPERETVANSINVVEASNPAGDDPSAQNTTKLVSTVETVPGSQKHAVATPVSAAGSTEDVETTTSISEAIPTEFETRNLGVTLEVDPVVGSRGRTIDLTLVPQHVRLLGMRKAEVAVKGSNKTVVVEQPEILMNRITTSIQVEDGEHTLLGIFKLQEPLGTMELFILHTQLRRIEKPGVQ